MTVQIPNLCDKYGGSKVLAKIVKEFSTAQLTHAALRRYLDGMTTAEVAASNLALIAMALGHPGAAYDANQGRSRYASLKLTTHAYEEMLGILRRILLANGFQSRDASIAINIIDMHAEVLLDVRTGRKVTSPFAGVDRRRLPRDPEVTGPSQRREPS